MESQWAPQLPEEVPPFMHITQNDFSRVKKSHGKSKEEDIAVCNCKYDANNPESDPQSACGERCLNVLTNTECTPGYCPSSEHCRNQKFQKCDYAKTKLFKTEGRGWGLLADQNIKAGQFIIEYCGEVISSDEAKQRTQTYVAQGLKDAYIISLSANYYIDATKKGSLARFINHSCQPNCETRKWQVLGETRVGIFAKEDISVGTELAYDYNFEWYGGATVRCMCGAANCSLFLGAKSHGFQEYNHVWEEGDARYTVENVPLYDSAEDEAFPTLSFKPVPKANADSPIIENVVGPKIKVEEAASGSGSQFSFGAQNVAGGKSVETETNKKTETSRRSQPAPKKSQKGKASGKKQASSKPVAELFKSKKVQDEIRRAEERKNKATSDLNSLYDEIRPTILAHENNQDNVPTSVAERWIAASCNQMSAEAEYSFSIIKNLLPRRPVVAKVPEPPVAVGGTENGSKEEVKK